MHNIHDKHDYNYDANYRHGDGYYDVMNRSRLCDRFSPVNSEISIHDHDD